MSDEKSRGGRPLKFPTPEALQAEIDKYFLSTEPQKVTITGLALFLDTTRETLMDYQNRDEFTDTVKKAKLRVEQEYESDLRRAGRSGDIFALKNFGWRDQQQVDQTISGPDGKPIEVRNVRVYLPENGRGS